MPGAIRMRPRRSRGIAGRGREDGQPGEHEVDLGDRARRPDVVCPPEQARADGHGIGQPGEEAFRIDAGDNGTRGDLLAAGEHHARRPAVMRGDGADLGVGPDLDTGFAGGRLEGRRQRARAAAGEDRLTGRSPIVARRVGQQHGRRSRRPRPHRRVLDAAPGDRRLERIGLERFGHEIGDRHRQDAGDRPAVVAPEATERPPELEPGESIAQTGRFDVRRRPAGDLAKEARQRADERRRTRRTRRRRRPTEPEAHPPSERRRSTGRSRRRPPPVRRPAPPARPSDSPWRFRSRSRTTDGRNRPTVWASVGTRAPGASSEVAAAPPTVDAPLQDHRPQPGLAQVRSGDKAVVSAADDDRVVAVGLARSRHRYAAFRPRARRTSSAAIRPFAPMIPPPGWVADPHSHRSRTGVLKRA